MERKTKKDINWEAETEREKERGREKFRLGGESQR